MWSCLSKLVQLVERSCFSRPQKRKTLFWIFCVSADVILSAHRSVRVDRSSRLFPTVCGPDDGVLISGALPTFTVL
jgi:hypothetical protein